MATLYITEYAGTGKNFDDHTQIAMVPPTAEQTVAIGGSSTASSAFANNTSYIRLHTDSICSIKFGTAPTATATTARMNANTTEYFGIPAGQAYKVAVISNT